MKTQSTKFKNYWVVTLLLSSVLTVQAQDDKKAGVTSIIEARQYVFVADRALPVSGRARELSPGYKLELRTDTLISDLPYFGRAYTAPIDPSQGGFQFTSTDFEYQSSPGKKGGWDISIKPKDAKDVNKFSLDISKNGRASLQVVSNNKQPISFSGYIREIKKTK